LDLLLVTFGLLLEGKEESVIALEELRFELDVALLAALSVV